jgi:hypothetical protein
VLGDAVDGGGHGAALLFGESYMASRRAWCSAEGEAVDADAALTPLGRVAVWSHAKGDYFMDLASAMLRSSHCFPGIPIVWTHDPGVHCSAGTASLAVVSVFTWEQFEMPPPFMPAVLWTAEQLQVEWPRAPVLSVVSRVPRPGQSFIPQAFLRNVPLDTPPSLRLFEDDVGARPLAVGYFNSHCTTERQLLFALLQRMLGPRLVVARGWCAGERANSADEHFPGVWSDRGTLVAMSVFRMVISMENTDVPQYVTEKLVNGFLSGAVPIHWGSRDFTASVFNARAFVSVHDFDDMVAAAEYIAALAMDVNRLRAMRAEPVGVDMAHLNDVLRWDVNNAKAFPAETMQLGRGLRAAWGATGGDALIDGTGGGTASMVVTADGSAAAVSDGYDGDALPGTALSDNVAT